jgi:hypothetical protein
MASQDDILAQVNGINANLAKLISVFQTRFALGAFGGSFICGAAVSTTVTDANAKTTSKVMLTPTNAAGGTLQGSVKCLYVSAKNNGSFVVSTSSGVAAAGTETFDYEIVNTG